MPNQFGKFDIWSVGKPSVAKKVVVWLESSEDAGTLIVSCNTPKEAEQYCEYLNAVIQGQIKIPRNRRNWK